MQVKAIKKKKTKKFKRLTIPSIKEVVKKKVIFLNYNIFNKQSGNIY